MTTTNDISKTSAYQQKLMGNSAAATRLRCWNQPPRCSRNSWRHIRRRSCVTRPFAGKWTPNEIIGHLTDTECVLGFRSRLILCEDHPVIAPMDQIGSRAERPNEREPRDRPSVREDLIKPFRENGVTTLVPRNDWGTDHMAFDAVGLPAFDMLQDQLDYWSHTHHSNVDTVDHVLPQDLMISAAFMATLAYHAATREELMPRETLPLPLPLPGPLPEILQD